MCHTRTASKSYAFFKTMVYYKCIRRLICLQLIVFKPLIEDIPQSEGKTVLLKILNSPKADFSKLQQIASDYERKALEMMEEVKYVKTNCDKGYS